MRISRRSGSEADVSGPVFMPTLPNAYSPEAEQELESDGLAWATTQARLPMGRICKITCVPTNCVYKYTAFIPSYDADLAGSVMATARFSVT